MISPLAADPSASYTFALDNLGRATGISQTFAGLSQTVGFTQQFDAAGNRTGLSADIGGTHDFTNEYQFDGLNRNTRITQESQGSGSGYNSVAAKRVDLAYNAIGEFTQVNRYSDLAGTAVVATSTYGYDALARLTFLAHKRADNSSINTYTWGFDSLNRITSQTSVDGNSTFTYDTTSQLTGAAHSYQANENYVYDANGNRTENGQVTGAANRLLNDGTYTYDYDGEENRTKRTKISDGTITEYAWDYRNRLTLVTSKTAGGVTTKRVGYEYDAFDHRIGKKVDANGDGSWDRTDLFVWDGLDVVLDFVDADGDGSAGYALATRRLFGPAVDQVLAEEDVASTAVQWLLADNQGTIRDVVNSSGQLLSGGHFQYDTFGRIISGNTALTRFLYTAQEYDPDTGLYYFNARWYDPFTHQFLSVDPLRDGKNWVVYVGNNSPNATDPRGFQSVPARWGALTTRVANAASRVASAQRKVSTLVAQYARAVAAKDPIKIQEIGAAITAALRELAEAAQEWTEVSQIVTDTARDNSSKIPTDIATIQKATDAIVQSNADLAEFTRTLAKSNADPRWIALSDGFAHSWEAHSEEWCKRFNEKISIKQWHDMVIKAMDTKEPIKWDVQGKPTFGFLTMIDGNKPFFVQFYSDTNQMATAFVPNDKQLSAIRQLISEAKK